MTRRTTHVPLPTSLPGEFFVLVWNRESQQFELHVDDEDQSSYQMGSDIPKAMAYFANVLKLGQIGDRAIDVAKEFGAAQVMFREPEPRVLMVFDRKAVCPALRFPSDSDPVGMVQLPSTV